MLFGSLFTQLHATEREMKQVRDYVRYYRLAINPATSEASKDLFLTESGDRMSDDNISRSDMFRIYPHLS